MTEIAEQTENNLPTTPLETPLRDEAIRKVLIELRPFLIRYLSNRGFADAEDVVHDCIVKVLEKVNANSSLRCPAKLQDFCFKTVRKVALARIIDDNQDDDVRRKMLADSEGFVPKNEPPTPEELLDLEGLQDRIVRCLCDLNPKYGTTPLSAEVSFAEMAGLLDLTTATVIDHFYGAIRTALRTRCLKQ